jgi:hypothetical protein
MKTYTFEVVIEEGNDEFWEEITAGGNSGCDNVRNEIVIALSTFGFESSVRLVAYSDELLLA